MSIKDEAREAEKKFEKARSHLKKEVMSEVGDIREGIDSIATNVVGLARNIKDVGVDRTRAATDYMLEQIDDLKAVGADGVKKVETRIRSKPGQSIALAFVAGAVASYLLGRRTS